jgi:hypothetical protein
MISGLSVAMIETIWKDLTIVATLSQIAVF